MVLCLFTVLTVQCSAVFCLKDESLFVLLWCPLLWHVVQTCAVLIYVVFCLLCCIVLNCSVLFRPMHPSTVFCLLCGLNVCVIFLVMYCSLLWHILQPCTVFHNFCCAVLFFVVLGFSELCSLQLEDLMVLCINSALCCSVLCSVDHYCAVLFSIMQCLPLCCAVQHYAVFTVVLFSIMQCLLLCCVVQDYAVFTAVLCCSALCSVHCCAVLFSVVHSSQWLSDFLCELRWSGV